MSNKKMKGVAKYQSSYGLSEDTKARFNHQRLLQDFHDVKKETEAAKSKLEAMKQRKLTLLAEVRFLRQRHKDLLEIKAANSPQGPKGFHQPISQLCRKNKSMENNGSKKQVKLQSKASMWDPNMREMSPKSKKYALKSKESNVNRKGKIDRDEAFPGNKNPGFGLKRKDRNFGAKEDAFKHPSEVVHWNKKESVFVEKETDPELKNFGFDLNQMERSYQIREEVVLNRAPVFDLNLKLGEEDNMHENPEASRYEEPESSFIGGSEEQLNDLQVSICRNLENLPNPSGKRKISWQDPVALKV